jgi:hypothetical protein
MHQSEFPSVCRCVYAPDIIGLFGTEGRDDWVFGLEAASAGTARTKQRCIRCSVIDKIDNPWWRPEHQSIRDMGLAVDL